MIFDLKDANKIVAPVTLEETDNPQYIGHYTVDALDQFITILKKKYEPNRMLAMKIIYNNGYILAGNLDDDDQVKEPLHFAVAGCAHGRDGSE